MRLHEPQDQKDQLYPDEIQEMARQNFSKVKEKPCSIDLGFIKKYKGDQYDDLIAGWTKYWNDIFKPETPLDPNVVKALIASESGFDPKRLANKKLFTEPAVRISRNGLFKTCFVFGGRGSGSLLSSFKSIATANPESVAGGTIKDNVIVEINGNWTSGEYTVAVSRNSGASFSVISDTKGGTSE